MGLVATLKLVAAAAVLVALAYGVAYLQGRSAGRADLATEIEREAHETYRRSEDARDAVDRCYDDGSVWDRRRGGCVPRVP